MMVIQFSNTLIHTVILDISGVYVQIYDQGYFDSISLDKVKKQYSNKEHWQVLVLD